MGAVSTSPLPTIVTRCNGSFPGDFYGGRANRAGNPRKTRKNRVYVVIFQNSILSVNTHKYRRCGS
jgi:hypothetical protein